MLDTLTFEISLLLIGLTHLLLLCLADLACEVKSEGWLPDWFEFGQSNDR